MRRRLEVHNPTQRWERVAIAYDEGEAPVAELAVVADKSRSILAENDSPDVGFRYSVNPYRGCTHACAYCYARPGHEYLSLGAGTDFERRIVYKPDAAALLREAFDAPRWRGELVAFSGVTDCYQPLERTLGLTRGCLEVCAEYQNPVAVITKSPLVERDVDVLADLARRARVRVSVSVPFWIEEHARALEPFVTTPARRLRIVERLAAAGVPVGVSVSPIVPGLNDADIPEILRRAADAGATHAFYVLLRLPGPVREVFEERLRAALPLRADRVLARVREVSGGKMYDARFGVRGRGAGPYAEMIAQVFATAAARHGLGHGPTLDGASAEAEAAQETTFRRPRGQLTLF